MPRLPWRRQPAPDPSRGRLARSDDRATTTRADGSTTRHSFSFGDHYDPENLSFGPLRAVNEELVPPGGGFDAHRHADVEIVTWVLEGVLAHEDSTGQRGRLHPGQVQHLSAGSGVEHSERNASDSVPLRYVQMELAPSDEQLRADPEPPVYRQAWTEGARGILFPAVTVREGVVMSVAILDTDDHLRLPADVPLHLHLTRGSVVLDDLGTLRAGDTVRLPAAPARTLVAWADSEVLVWSLPRTDDPPAS
ncbi:pirin family protein [Solicola sp. PLA-1-18]|uniref:pirin family protein n=1 Tax=Solicola sp. PLA-1-18 TaxID=3380532 RepID=UPI003B7B962F